MKRTVSAFQTIPFTGWRVWHVIQKILSGIRTTCWQHVAVRKTEISNLKQSSVLMHRVRTAHYEVQLEPDLIKRLLDVKAHTLPAYNIANVFSHYSELMCIDQPTCNSRCLSKTGFNRVSARIIMSGTGVLKVVGQRRMTWYTTNPWRDVLCDLHWDLTILWPAPVLLRRTKCDGNKRPQEAR